MGRIALLLVTASLAACGGEASGVDAGTAADAQGASDASGTVSSTCTGDCATMSLEILLSGVTRQFDRAFFGLTAPAMSDSGEWEVYIENNAGNDDRCPAMDSPTPDYLMIVAGLPLPEKEATSTSAAVNLVDFEGALLPSSPLAKANSSTVQWVAADLCTDCAAGSEADRVDRMLAIELQAPFDGGMVAGHIYATHCNSLDTL